MEIEELKNIWNQFDKKLTENLRLNEDLLKKINLDKSKREMSTPFRYEIVTVFIGIVLLVLVSSGTIRYLEQLKFLISGIVSILLIIVFLILSIKRLKLITDIDYYNSSIIDLQKALNKLKIRYLQHKKLELIISPIFAISFLLIFAKTVRNYDFFLHPYRFWISLILGLGIGYSIIIWIYKNWYEKKIKIVSTFLEELVKFEKEE